MKRIHRVRGGHYCPSLPSEPCMQLSPHTAQADRYLPCCPTAAAPDCLFISGSVCKANGSHLTCPSDFDRPFRSRQVVHQAHVSTLSVGQTPYPAGYGFPLPFGCWRSLLGPSFPAEEFRPSCVGPTGLAGPQRGFHVPLLRDATGEDAVCTPGSLVSLPVLATRTCLRAARRCILTHYRRMSHLVATTCTNEASSTVYLRSSVQSSPSPSCPYGSDVSWTFPLAV